MKSEDFPNTRVRKLLIVVVAVSAALAFSIVGLPLSDQSAHSGVADAQENQFRPLTIDTEYTGQSPDADHAMLVTVRLTPQSEVLTNTTLSINPTDRAFLDPSSVDTEVTTKRGQLVLERVDDQVGHYEINRLEPGEEVAVTLRLYPRQLVPSGERLAIVGVRARYDSNERIVEERRFVNPDVESSTVAVVDDPEIPSYWYGGGGFLGGFILAGGIAVAILVYWRRTIRTRIESIADELMSNTARQQAKALIQDLGGHADSMSSHGLAPAHGGSQGTTSQNAESGTESDAGDLTVVDTDE